MDADCVQWGVDPCPGSAINNGTMGPATMAMAPGLGDEDHPDGEVNRIASQSFGPESSSAIPIKAMGWGRRADRSVGGQDDRELCGGRRRRQGLRQPLLPCRKSRLLISRAFWVAPFQRCPPRGLLSVTARLVVFAPRGLCTSATIVAIRSGFTSLISPTSSPRSTADPLPSSDIAPDPTSDPATFIIVESGSPCFFEQIL